MRTHIFTAMLLSVFMFPGTQLRADVTSSNLLAAYKGEFTAAAKYAAFAEQASKEGFVQIAVLFSAAARSEAIHAANHKAVLEKMGTVVAVVKPEFTIKSTKENLDAAIKGEGDEVQSMYPAYIASAKQENQANAVKSMRWAMETERKHLIYFQNALASLNDNALGSLPKFYWVCPKCGNTFNAPEPEAMCSFCGTPNSKFIKVAK
jgi:rubrerythrin